MSKEEKRDAQNKKPGRASSEAYPGFLSSSSLQNAANSHFILLMTQRRQSAAVLLLRTWATSKSKSRPYNSQRFYRPVLLCRA